MQVERENLRIIACPHVLSTEKGRIDVQRPAGGNVKDLLRSIAWVPESLNARVFIDGRICRRTRPGNTRSRSLVNRSWCARSRWAEAEVAGKGRMP